MLGFNALSEAPLSALPDAAASGAITASLAITFGGLTTTSAATVDIQAVASATLGNLTLSATAKLALKGSLAVTFGALTTTSAAKAAIKAAAAITLGNLTAAGEGTIVSDTGASLSGLRRVTLTEISRSVALTEISRRVTLAEIPRRLALAA